MQIYLPIAEMSLNAFMLLGRCSGFSVGHVRRRRRLFDDAAAVLYRCPAGGGGRDRSQPGGRRIRFGRAGALAARQCRYPNGRRADDRRFRRFDPGCLAVHLPARHRPDRFRDRGILCPVSRHCRPADGGRKHPCLVSQPQSVGAQAQASPPHMAARAAVQDAGPPFEALYQCAAAPRHRCFCNRSTTRPSISCSQCFS